MKKRLGLFFILCALLPLVNAAATAPVSSPWKYYFSTNGTLYEAGSMAESSSPYFWLNSGAKLILLNGRGMTIQGDLPVNDYWRKYYSSDNPTDTDNGYHPQNLFRLLTRLEWQNFNQTVYFQIKKNQLSSSPNRAEHNGLLLMSRYQANGDTLYYAGLRVDGNAIIKKKLNGKYYTLASDKIFPGTYNKLTNPNLLPKYAWLGLRSEVKNNPDGSVTIKLYMDRGWSGAWTLIAQAIDKSSPIKTKGYAGIRTDFMDVVFDNYELRNA
ncbi:MAG TPA: hypothetical protein VJH92_06115 [Candidatus Nanoarchaeia archaeon]|nr:hypothetical protein [Candidatus Nanoarchaeia archaeon]